MKKNHPILNVSSSKYNFIMSTKASELTVTMTLTEDSRNYMIERILLDNGERALPLIKIIDMV